jgi:iron-sulfur cluster assembly protein
VIAVSDTSPLNYLILIGSIELLPQLFDRIYIPQAVINEMEHERTPAEARRSAASAVELNIGEVRYTRVGLREEIIRMSDTVLEAAEPIVTLTPAAVKQVKFLIEKQNRSAQCLRIAVKGGGCSGLSYVMNLEPAPTDRDLVFEVEGLTVIVDPKSARFIGGLNLDYSVKNLLEGGWRFSNPNAQRSCGCGTSFTPK